MVGPGGAMFAVRLPTDNVVSSDAEPPRETELKPVAAPEPEEKPALGAAAGAKGKRELPPYLRVIK